MAVGVGTAIEFPLNGNNRALAMRIAVLSDTPDAQAVIRFLADGQEIGRTPPVKAGDQPRFMQIKLHDPKKVTLVADASSSNVKILYIDPVSVRDLR